MTKNFEITIPKPCSQQWDSFVPQSGGRFCGSCEKVVVDFTKMSDQELFDYFKNNTNYVCGRFNPSQINKTLISNKKKKVFSTIKGLALSIIGILMSFAIKAQTIDSLKTKQAVEITPMPFKSSITENKVAAKMSRFEFPWNQKIMGAICRGIEIVEQKENGGYHSIVDMLRKF